MRINQQKIVAGKPRMKVMRVSMTLQVPETLAADLRIVQIIGERLRDVVVIRSLAVSGVDEECPCPVCGWRHDGAFRSIRLGDQEPILLSGVLPLIVGKVHEACERGMPWVSVKDDQLIDVCGSYVHPCKAFHALGRKVEYQRLFDTRRRGFVALRAGHPSWNQLE